MQKENTLKTQLIPIILTAITAVVLIGLLWLQIVFLNRFTFQDILLSVRWYDVAIGLTIYLKTAIDFAIFIGRLMHKYPTWKDRVAIEVGTAAGNALGTMLILFVWTFFKEVEWLLAIMIFIAALVLFKLAEDGLEHAMEEDASYPEWYKKIVSVIEHFLEICNKIFGPILKYLVPDLKVKEMGKKTFWSLFMFSFTVPFILGLDDFAGYVSLFSIINVFGFAIGVFLGHMVLNIALYIKPEATIRAVKNPTISLLGSLFFIGIGIWGLVEVVRILSH